MLTLTEIKNHLRIDATDDDNALGIMLDTAIAAIDSYLENPAVLLNDSAPEPVKSAALLLIGDLYENRSAQTDKKLVINATYERLLNPYRVMVA